MKEKRVIIGLSALVLLCIGASSALAGGCPEKTVAEEGGTHWCYSDGKAGHVHLWKPGSYDRDRAVTVVYVHGYNLGDDGCSSSHYVDCAWEKHRLAKQFEASGLDALFIAIEAPVNDAGRPKWTLGALLDSVKHHGGIRPPLPVVAVGHSGGAFTLEKFLKDDRLRHVILLDAGYKKAPKEVSDWYKADGERRLTLIGAEGTYWSTGAMDKKLKCADLDDKDARCAALIDPKMDHMGVIRSGVVMPKALRRVRQPPPPKPKPKAKPKSPHRKRHRR